MHAIRAGAALATMMLTISPSLGGNWPRFLGPNGSATASANLPLNWSDSTVIWKKELPGYGISSPVVWDDRLFVTAASEDGRERSLLCYDAKNGALRWERKHTFDTHKKHKKNSYATATPTTDGNRVAVTFTSADAHRVYVYSNDGKLEWERDLGRFEGEHSGGASPIFHEGKLIISNDQDGPSSIVALDPATGKDIWRAERPATLTAYSTPLVAPTPDGGQLICSSRLGVTSYSLKDGSERWRCHVFPKRVVGSPRLAGDVVIAHCGQGNKGDLMVGVRHDGQGDVAGTHLVWKLDRSIPYCTTPAAAGDYLYLIADVGGVMRCLDAKTGQEMWTHRLGGNFSASPLVVGAQIFLFAEDGQIHVVAADPKAFKPLARNRLDDSFLATPAVCDDRMFLRGARHLWCVGNP